MDKQFTASEVHERERFEEWYTTHACNYSRDPIGSRDCSLQWESWKAALTAHSAQAQPTAASVTECDFTTDEVNECFDHLVDDGPRLIPIEAIQQMREHCLLAAQENPNG